LKAGRGCENQDTRAPAGDFQSPQKLAATIIHHAAVYVREPRFNLGSAVIPLCWYISNGTPLVRWGRRFYFENQPGLGKNP
jgi:hypothetical protein